MDTEKPDDLANYLEQAGQAAAHETQHLPPPKKPRTDRRTDSARDNDILECLALTVFGAPQGPDDSEDSALKWGERLVTTMRDEGSETAKWFRALCGNPSARGNQTTVRMAFTTTAIMKNQATLDNLRRFNTELHSKGAHSYYANGGSGGDRRNMFRVAFIPGDTGPQTPPADFHKAVQATLKARGMRCQATWPASSLGTDTAANGTFTYPPEIDAAVKLNPFKPAIVPWSFTVEHHQGHIPTTCPTSIVLKNVADLEDESLEEWVEDARHEYAEKFPNREGYAIKMYRYKSDTVAVITTNSMEFSKFLCMFQAPAGVDTPLFLWRFNHNNLRTKEEMETAANRRNNGRVASVVDNTAQLVGATEGITAMVKTVHEEMSEDRRMFRQEMREVREQMSAHQNQIMALQTQAIQDKQATQRSLVALTLMQPLHAQLDRLKADIDRIEERVEEGQGTPAMQARLQKKQMEAGKIEAQIAEHTKTVKDSWLENTSTQAPAGIELEPLLTTDDARAAIAGEQMNLDTPEPGNADQWPRIEHIDD